MVTTPEISHRFIEQRKEPACPPHGKRSIERLSTLPMPHFAEFEYESWEAIEALEFDDPYDPRRYFEKIDDQINSVGDELNLGLPAHTPTHPGLPARCGVFPKKRIPFSYFEFLIPSPSANPPGFRPDQSIAYLNKNLKLFCPNQIRPALYVSFSNSNEYVKQHLQLE